MNWIKCIERMPEEKKEVLIWNDESRKIGYYAGKINVLGNFLFYTDSFYVDDITHWAELPPPPTE